MSENILAELIGAVASVLAAVVSALLARPAAPPPAVEGAGARSRWLKPILLGVLVLAVGGATTWVVGRKLEGRPPPCATGKLAVLSDASAAGTAMANGFRLAVEEYNRDHPDCVVDVATFDPGTDHGVGAATAMARDKAVIGVVSAAYSATIERHQPIFERAGLAAITPTAGGTVLSPTLFRTLGTNTQQAVLEAGYLRGSGARVFLIGDGKEGGRTVLAAVRAGLGGAPAGEATLPGTPTYDQLSDVTDQIRRSGASAVYHYGSESAAKRVWELLDRRITVLAPTGYPCRARVETSGAAAEADLIYTSTCLPTDRIPGVFAASYRQRFGSEPIGYSVNCYDAAGILLAALAGGVDSREELRAWLRRYSGEGLAGTYRFTAAGERQPESLVLWRSASTAR